MRQQQERAWHYIKPNEISRQPRRHIFIDSEARISRLGKTHEQKWRLAVAIFQEVKRNGSLAETESNYDSARDLWADVSTFCDRPGRTVVWAHNLGYDARIAGLFESLSNLGWNLTGHNISSTGSWFEFRNGTGAICFADSTSVFPTTIANLGKHFGIAKPKMDLASDNQADWLNRCRSDCRILRNAITAYLWWLDSEDMGNWQITGSSQAWATYRHKFLTHKLCVHDDMEALAAERRAMWTGRCEAYWHGEFKNERVFEFDFEFGYPRIAKSNAIPVKFLGRVPDGRNPEEFLHKHRSSLLAEVRVATKVPCVPCSHNGRIIWPVGTFNTTLWDVEIREARASGADVQIQNGWLYRKNFALQAWADWIVGQLKADDSDVPAWRKIILKSWSRALIGRMAMTYRQWEEYATMPDSRVLSGTMYDRDADEEFDYMQVGKTMWRDNGRVEWAHSMPMITGYIQAIARVHLWRIMRSLPERSFIYVDTDSILVTEKHLQTVMEIASEFKDGVLRLKRAWDGFTILGPRQIVTGEQVRISGIPRRAQKTGSREFTGEIWDTLSGAIKRGNLDKVITRDRVWSVEGVDHRRRGTGFGWTEPIEIFS